jgi:hypothetical protein
MAVVVLLNLRRFREGAAKGWAEEDRIIAKAICPARFEGEGTFDVIGRNGKDTSSASQSDDADVAVFDLGRRRLLRGRRIAPNKFRERRRGPVLPSPNRLRQPSPA